MKMTHTGDRGKLAYEGEPDESQVPESRLLEISGWLNSLCMLFEF